MTTLETLEEARDLIRKPENWCRQKMFGDDSYCTLGAISAAKCPGNSSIEPLMAVHRMLPPGVCSLATFNDTHTHAEVLELFNLAIAAELKAQENKPKVGSSNDGPTLVGEPVLSGAC